MENLAAFISIVLVSLLLIGVLLTVTRYAREIRAARRRLEGLGSQVIETACGPVEFARVGEGYPVLVVHGALGGFDQGLILARSIDIPDLQIISVSRFGFLRSPVPPGATLDTQADAYAALLDALGIRRAAVFAVSAGSTSAIRFAARHPQRVSGLVLMGPDAPGEEYMQLPPRWLSQVFFGNDFVYWALIHFFGKRMRFEAGMVPRGHTLTPKEAALVENVQKSALSVSQKWAGWYFETYTGAEELRASVTPASPYPPIEMRTPVLVILAEDDPIALPANVRALAGQMPNARLYTVPDGGHLLFGHEREASAEVARFLRACMSEAHPSLSGG